MILKKRLSHVQIIAFGYLFMILLGAGLLMLPVASQAEGSVGFTKAFFTATSSSCVTGLALCDTATTWTLFGQIVILFLIQIGGLGFMTIATFFFLLMSKRMGLYQRETMVESINATKIGGIMRLSGIITLGTLMFEGLGAIALAFRFVPEFGWGKGIWYSVFHAISAFCNAGFDLMGVKEPFSSFVAYNDDPLVNITLICLITIGALGFLVWEDIMKCGIRWKKYKLHTKLVLSTTIGLFVFGTLLFFFLEKDYTGAGKTTGVRILEAMFSAVTPRTAGFNTVDTAALSETSILLTILYMLIGGSPGSTAGGVKTTTISIILIFLCNSLIGRRKTTVFGRTISDDTLKKAIGVLAFNVSLGLIATMLICGIYKLPLLDIIFESYSAINTVGMTTGITRSLTGAGIYIVAFLMYLGRVGSVTFAVALLGKRAKRRIEYPTEEITVG